MEKGESAIERNEEQAGRKDGALLLVCSGGILGRRRLWWVCFRRRNQVVSRL